MTRQRIEFRLSMPSRGSWNGEWSGAGRDYVLYRYLPTTQADAVLNGGTRRSWFYRWDDGWSARIDARIMERGERKRKSDGFSGYDWMVENILRRGNP